MATTSNKRKKAVVAAVTAAAILLAGTFAWTSISQTAKNEAVVDINAGARPHDDFDGTNKDVYVENFGDEETGVDIYARIRLDEYMEVGQDAGEDRENADRRALPVVEGTNINDKSTWTTFVYGEETQERAYGKYWGWDMGNAESHKPYYMPTFNKNKDSLVPDINGTYEGLNAGDIVHYDDYVPYDASSKITADAVYDWDLNNIDEVEKGNPSETTDESTPLDEANILKKSETHDAQQITSGATIMTMEQWKALPENQKVGPYWVYDTDGWAYWAQPIAPGETTGLLLDGIHMSRVPDDNWYYGINAIGQFVTAADISGFTRDGDTLSDDALDLLSKITGIGESFVIEGPVRLEAGGEHTYAAVFKNAGAATELQPDTVEWNLTVDEAFEDVITFDASNGYVYVSEDAEPGITFTLTAVGTFEDEREVQANKTVTVTEGEPEWKYDERLQVCEKATLQPVYSAMFDSEASLGVCVWDDEAGGYVEVPVSRWELVENPDIPLVETTLTEDGVLSIGENETAGMLSLHAYIEEGDWAGYYVDTGLGINYPVLQFEMEREDGTPVSDYGDNVLLGAGESMIVSLSDDYMLYDMYGTPTNYHWEGMSFDNEDVEWHLDAEYSYQQFVEGKEPTYTFEEYGDRGIKITHTCTEGNCDCSYFLQIWPYVEEHPDVNGWIGFYVYKNNNSIDTMHIVFEGVRGVFANNEGGAAHDVTFNIENDFYTVIMTLGECNPHEMEWELTDTEGKLGNSYVEGIFIHLDPETKPTHFKMVGTYKESDYYGNTFDQSISITFNVTVNYEE